MTARTSPTNEIVFIDRHRREALLLRDRNTCELMRGAGVTMWSLVAGAGLLLAVVAFVPHNTVSPRLATTGAPITVALSHH
jgi:hypothetical protein